MFKGLNLFQKLLYLLNILAVVVLLLAYSNIWINPAKAPYLALLGLFYPLWALCNAFFVLAWLVQRKRQAFASLVALLIGWPLFNGFYQWRPKLAERSETDFRVMTYNVRNFNVDHWLKGPKIVKLGIEKMVQDLNPDVIFFQEYAQYFLTPELPNYARAFQKSPPTINFGFATYSKFPILQSGLVSYNLDGAKVVGDFAFSDLLVNGDTIRFFNVHLASIKLEFHKYGFIKDPLETEQAAIERDVKEIFRRLRTAFQLRGQQIPVLLEAIRNSPYPVMVCGDINDPPMSFAAYQLSRTLNDSYRESGAGWVKTFVKAPFPLRIDYIFHSNNFQSFNHQIVNEIYSDHFPVVVDFKTQTP